MQFYEFDAATHQMLAKVFPGALADRYALVPETEYRLWRKLFQQLQQGFFDHFEMSKHTEAALRRLPIVQWVAKLLRPEKFSSSVPLDPALLIPKAFKMSFLATGTYRNFGYNGIAISMLDALASRVPFKTIRWEPWTPEELLLGVLVGSDPTASYLSLYVPCCRTDQIQVFEADDGSRYVQYRDERYVAAIPTAFASSDLSEASVLWQLDTLGLLAPPMTLAPTKLQNWMRFRNLAWASVYPFDYFEDRVIQDPNFEDCLLIRIDDGIVPYRWREVQNDPVLRLDLEMQDYWVWQDHCTSPHDDVTLYWTPCFKYPWLTNREGAWIPVLIQPEEEINEQ
jgi:hypothetical protein